MIELKPCPICGNKLIDKQGMISMKDFRTTDARGNDAGDIVRYFVEKRQTGIRIVNGSRMEIACDCGYRYSADAIEVLPHLDGWQERFINLANRRSEKSFWGDVKSVAVIREKDGRIACESWLLFKDESGGIIREIKTGMLVADELYIDSENDMTCIIHDNGNRETMLEVDGYRIVSKVDEVVGDYHYLIRPSNTREEKE